MSNREEEGNKTNGQATNSKDNDASGDYDILMKVHMATGNNTHVRTYVVRSLPSDVIEGLKAETSLKNKPTKIENSKAALTNCTQWNFIEIFRTGSTPSEFHRLDVNLERLEAIASDTSVFGSVFDWGDVLFVRYEKCFRIIENKTMKVEGASKEPVILRERLST